MNVSKLDKQLDEAIESFLKEINLRFPAEDESPAQIGDLNEFGKQVAYLADDFRKLLVEFLKK